jgi:hypothetical protein
MSLHVYLIDPTDEPVYWANVTHNLTKMASEAGIYEAVWRPEELNVEFAEDLIPYVEDGLKALKSDTNYYKQFNPKNGWGNYEILLEFLEEYLKALKKYPKARIVVSR